MFISTESISFTSLRHEPYNDKSVVLFYVKCTYTIICLLPVDKWVYKNIDMFSASLRMF